jgi:hypothetical protein
MQSLLDNKKTRKTFLKHVKEKNLKILVLDKKFTELECIVCGHAFSIQPRRLLYNKSGCQKCRLIEIATVRKNRASTEYTKFCKSKNLKLLDKYVNAHVKLKHKCLDCKTEFKVKPNTQHRCIDGFNGCPTCKKSKLSVRSHRSDEYHINLIEKCEKVKVLKLIRCNNLLHLVKVECLKCNYIYKAPPSDLKDGHGCSICARSMGNKTKLKTFKYKGVSYKLQGYEPQALKYLIKKKKIKQNTIVAGTPEIIPIINYSVGNKVLKYYPDFYIPTKNKIYEVKSEYTLGLTDRNIYYRVRLKARAAVEAGYKYSIMVMTEDRKRLKMPKDWLELSHSKFKKAFNELNTTSF